MSVSRALAAVAVAFVVAGCGSDFRSSPSSKRASGGAVIASSVVATLSFERTIDLATESGGAALVARARGPRIRAGTLSTPGGERLALEPAPDDAVALVVSAASDGVLVERFTAGMYTFELELFEGRRTSTSLVVFGGFSAFPIALDPAHGARGVARLPTIRFSGDAPLHDVRLLEEATGRIYVAAVGTTLPSASPGAPLVAERGYRLELTGVTRELERDGFRFASTSVSRFETGGP